MNLFEIFAIVVGSLRIRRECPDLIAPAIS
jgi:hypothetical protein